MLLLDHVGAKSGAKRTAPLLYFDDGDAVVIVASKGGYPKHPAWFHNLRANPETTVQIGRERRPVRARVATPEEHARLWPVPNRCGAATPTTASTPAARDPPRHPRAALGLTCELVTEFDEWLGATDVGRGMSRCLSLGDSRGRRQAGPDAVKAVDNLDVSP